MVTYRDLTVWQKSMTLARRIYEITTFYPEEERFGLVSQMRRCSVSIPSNIAEGAGRNSDKELLRFCLISQGSLAELETQLLISAELDYIKSNNDIFEQLITVRKILSGYISYLNTKLTKQST